MAALLYDLLKPVNRSLSLIAAHFRLAACAFAPVNYLLELAPLRILSGANPVSGMKPAELQAVALLLHRLHGTASDIVIVAGCAEARPVTCRLRPIEWTS